MLTSDPKAFKTALQSLTMQSVARPLTPKLAKRGDWGGKVGGGKQAVVEEEDKV